MFTFPDHNIDPKKKDREWILKYCRAAWDQNGSGTHMSYISQVGKYQTLRDYAQGKQSISGYRRMLGGSESHNDEWLKISWEPLAILPVFLERALARLKKYEYNVVAQPIDPNSKAEIDKFFKKQEAKIMLRQELQKLDPSLTDISPVAKKEGDAEDFDELKIMREYSYKHQLAAELEEAMEAVLNDNKFDEERSQMIEDLLFYGVGGYKEEVGHDGRIYARRVDPSQLITAPTVRRDFSDAEYVGEIRFITISDLRRLAPDMTEPELEKVAKMYLGKFGNPKSFPRTKIYQRAYDDFKIRVLDIEFDSTNRMTYEEYMDKRGNKRIVGASINKAGKDKKNGRYRSFDCGVVYRASWVVETDVLYNYGIARDMKRRNADYKRTEKSYHIRAYSMSGGRWTSKLEQCTQIVDIICLTWYKLQQTIAEARPANGFSFDLSALEEIPLGTGGKQLTPDQVVDLLLKKNIFPYRSMDSEGNRAHYVPINPLGGGIGNAAAEYFSVIQQNIALLQQTLGISEVSAGGAPERMATAVAEISDQSTEDALASVAEAERFSFESMLNGISLRIKTLARKNKNKNYEFLIGTESMKFFKLSPLYSARELSIKLENKPDYQEKRELLMLAQKYMDGGLLEFSDLIMIKNMDNLKKSEMILDYKIKKRKEEQQKQAMMQQQQNGQVQQQSAMMAEQARQQTMQIEYQLKMQLLQMEKEYDMQIEQIRQQARLTGEQMKSQVNMSATEMKTESKEYQTELLASLQAGRPMSKKTDDVMRK